MEGVEISGQEAKQFLAVRRKTNCDYDSNGIRVSFREESKKASGKHPPAGIKRIRAGLLTVGHDKKSFVGKAIEAIPSGTPIEIRRDGDVYVLFALIESETQLPRSIASKFPPPDDGEFIDDGLGIPFTPGKFFKHGDGTVEWIK